jgi:hypothetical protein
VPFQVIKFAYAFLWALVVGWPVCSPPRFVPSNCVSGSGVGGGPGGAVGCGGGGGSYLSATPRAAPGGSESAPSGGSSSGGSPVASPPRWGASREGSLAELGSPLSEPGGEARHFSAADVKQEEQVLREWAMRGALLVSWLAV